MRSRIGFFLHVPMPSSDLLAALPDHERLFEGLSSYDLVGFQTERDLERFQDYVRLFGRGRVVEHGVLETPRAGACAPARFRSASTPRTSVKQAAAAVASPAVKRLAASLSGRALAIGVDRLDYSKGLPERFRAFERLPAAPSRSSAAADLPADRTGLARRSARVPHLAPRTGAARRPHQRRARRADWTPVRYVNRNYPHSAADRLLPAGPRRRW